MASPKAVMAAEPLPQGRDTRHLGTWCALWLASAAGLFAVVYLVALALHAHQTSAWYQSGLTAFGAQLLDTTWKDIGEAIAAGVCIFAGLAAPRFPWKRFSPAEPAFTRLASHQTHAILLVGALPLLV